MQNSVQHMTAHKVTLFVHEADKFLKNFASNVPNDISQLDGSGLLGNSLQFSSSTKVTFQSYYFNHSTMCLLFSVR